MATTRNAKMVLENNFGETIQDAKLTLTSSAHDPYIISVDILDAEERSFAKDITFETGAAPAYDHWKVEFKTMSGTKWKTPNDDRCNLSSSEEGQVIVIRINDKKRENFTVDIENGCTFMIKKD